ncbi:MAG: DUF4270 domain-containing protein, partial [Bacteroidales bacterium]|nr:DUF4270 domain-containing protein [Bacteroidales bacterium]
YKDDSVLSSKVASGILVAYIDPVFGKTRSSFVMQIIPGSISGFGDNPVADSIKLFLRYIADSTAPLYGNMNAEMQIKIREVKSNLSIDSSYYTFYKPQWLDLGDVLAETTYFPQDGRNDTVVLSVNLNTSFGQRIMDDYDQWDDVVDPRDTSFTDYFKGMYIESNDIGYDGALSIFNIVNAETKAVLYYHNTEDTLQLSFFVPSISIRFNMVEQLYDAPGFLPDLDNPESKEDSVVYIQGLGGLKTRLKIPGLDSLKKSGLWGVNKAEIILHAENSSISQEEDFPAPPKLKILAIKPDGSTEVVVDYIGQTSYLGVNYEDGSYLFDITYYVQQILSGAIENDGFYILSNSDYDNPSRVVITGTKHQNPLQMRLTLRKIN